MKLFWKLFCGTVLVTVLSCSLTSFLLLETQFRSSLDREVDALFQENDLLSYAIILHLEGADLTDPEKLGELVDQMEISTGQAPVSFRLSSRLGVHISGSLPMDAKPLIRALQERERGWELVRDGANAWLHAASPMSLGGNTVYLENIRNVSSLVEQREEQYRSFFMGVPLLAGAAALAAMAMAAVMLRPLEKLSAASRRFAEGELDVRVQVSGDDEIGQLSRDFNSMAERLEDQMERLRAETRRQEDFIGSFTHELKTPLTSMIGYAELLRSNPEDRDQVLESAGYIFREGRRLEALSRKLLDLIVLERQDLTLRQVFMDFFLEQVGGAVRPVMEDASLDLIVRADPAVIQMDPDLIEAVCLNLLDNARKATEPGGEVRLEGTAEPGGYRIEVTDTGRGIPEEELDRVTEAFYMVDKSRARAQGGAGLGLALCQRILLIHGGTLEMKSRLGEGTKVTVRLKETKPATSPKDSETL